jgi:putative transposase
MTSYLSFLANLAAPFHPQTNGKLERYHRTIKQEVNQVPYERPSQLERSLADFVDYYIFRRYHKALGDVTPADVLYGRREHILQLRKEMRARPSGTLITSGGFQHTASAHAR